MPVSALNETGEPVDWWFLYKVPQLKKDANADSATGYEYVYYDPVVKNVARSPNLLTSGKGALGQTLASILRNPEATTGWILYNDAMPAKRERRQQGQSGPHERHDWLRHEVRDRVLAAAFVAAIR